MTNMKQKPKYAFPIIYEPIFTMVMNNDEICRDFINLVLEEENIPIHFEEVRVDGKDDYLFARAGDTGIAIVYHGRDSFSDFSDYIFISPLSKGLHYRMSLNYFLKQTIVIIVCMFDEVEEGHPVYSWDYEIDEIERTHFTEKPITIVLNLAYEGDELQGRLKDIFDYFGYGTISEECELTRRLDESVNNANWNGYDYINFYERSKKWRRIGRIEKNEKKAIARKMLRKGISISDTVELTDLSEKEVKELKKNL